MSEGGAPLHVLLVEDSAEDAALIVATLRRGGLVLDWTRVETEAALREALDRQPWDIVLCDYALPNFDGPRAIRMAREMQADLSLIAISGTIGEEQAIASLQSGANDYLLKGNLARLVPVVQRELREAAGRRAQRLAESAQRVAEEALRRSEEHYRVLFERNPIPMWVYDRATWRVLQVNEAALTHYGYSRAEFLELSVLQLRPLEEIPRLLASVAATGNDGPLTRGIWRHVNKQGDLMTVEVVTQPIVHHGMEARIAQALDITERMGAEEALSRIKMAVEFASDAISVADAAGRAIFLNRAHMELFGYEVEQLNAIGGPGALLVDPGVVPKLEAGLATVGSWSGETVLRTVSGRIVELFLRVNEVKNPDGLPIAYIGVGTDVGAIKRAHRTIAEQAALLDEAQDAIMVNDLHGCIGFWSKGAERVLGWTAPEAIGKCLPDFLCDPGAHAAAMAVVLKEGLWSGELAVRTREDREVLIESRWTLVRDEFGAPKAVLAIATDITQKRMLESQFLRAQRMESIGTLAGGIAHDLNNVLGPIIMAVDLFKLTMRSPNDLELLETVEVSARRGAEMVKQVLSFARGIQGQRLLLEPARLLADVQKLARETFPKSISVSVSASAPEEIWNVQGDPTQLHQVLLNLCVNARDAMPQGGHLRLSAANLHVDTHFAAMHPDARPGDYVVLQVADDGIGMSPEVQERIFEPFFTTKEIGKGTGLGLSTTLAIARSHGGFLTLESARGLGTKFHVYLPADVDSTGALPDGVVGALPRGDGECVLVVDDEGSIRSITAQTLEAFGYRVITAVDGADGLAKYVQHAAEIAIVLTDMMMPVMDGAAMIRAIARLNPAVKIIATSGLAAKGAEAEAAGAGVKTFLAKPFTATTLLTTLRALLNAAH